MNHDFTFNLGEQRQPAMALLGLKVATDPLFPPGRKEPAAAL